MQGTPVRQIDSQASLSFSPPLLLPFLPNGLFQEFEWMEGYTPEKSFSTLLDL